MDKNVLKNLKYKFNKLSDQLISEDLNHGNSIRNRNSFNVKIVTKKNDFS